MQHGKNLYHESKGEIRRHMLLERSRKGVTFSSKYVPAREKVQESSLAETPKGRCITITKTVVTKKCATSEITEEITSECEESSKYLIKKLEVEDEDKFNEALNNSEEILNVRDGSLKSRGEFGWVAVIKEEVISMCHGRIRGSREMMSSSRGKAIGMYLAAFLFS